MADHTCQGCGRSFAHITFGPGGKIPTHYLELVSGISVDKGPHNDAERASMALIEAQRMDAQAARIRQREAKNTKKGTALRQHKDRGGKTSKQWRDVT